MTITLEAIKAEHSKVAEMIAKFEAQSAGFFEYNGKQIPLATGERYLATIISANGAKKEHIVLLPGAKENVNWKAAMDWAKSIGGELPDRCESALLFATMKEEFEPEWYWTREQRASYSDYAWYQTFYYGSQLSTSTDDKLRARAVRRLPIE